MSNRRQYVPRRCHEDRPNGKRVLPLDTLLERGTRTVGCKYLSHNRLAVSERSAAQPHLPKWHPFVTTNGSFDTRNDPFVISNQPIVITNTRFVVSNNHQNRTVTCSKPRIIHSNTRTMRFKSRMLDSWLRTLHSKSRTVRSWPPFVAAPRSFSMRAGLLPFENSSITTVNPISPIRRGRTDFDAVQHHQ